MIGVADVGLAGGLVVVGVIAVDCFGLTGSSMEVVLSSSLELNKMAFASSHVG